MKCIVIYDSAYGNTQKIAKHIAAACDAEAILVNEAALDDIAKADLVIVGSPTQGGRPTHALQTFLKELPEGVLKGKKVAVFDTRFAMKEHGVALRLLMKTIGFAAPRIGEALKQKGGHLVTSPKAFIVHDKEGPLKDSEVEHASTWGHMLLRS